MAITGLGNAGGAYDVAVESTADNYQETVQVDADGNIYVDTSANASVSPSSISSSRSWSAVDIDAYDSLWFLNWPGKSSAGVDWEVTLANSGGSDMEVREDGVVVGGGDGTYSGTAQGEVRVYYNAPNSDYTRLDVDVDGSTSLNISVSESVNTDDIRGLL